MASQFTFGDSFLNAYIGAQQRAQQKQQYEQEMNFKKQQALESAKRFNMQMDYTKGRDKVGDQRYADTLKRQGEQDALDYKANFFDNGTPEDRTDDKPWNQYSFEQNKNFQSEQAKAEAEYRQAMLAKGNEPKPVKFFKKDPNGNITSVWGTDKETDWLSEYNSDGKWGSKGYEIATTPDGFLGKQNTNLDDSINEWYNFDTNMNLKETQPVIGFQNMGEAYGVKDRETAQQSSQAETDNYNAIQEKLKRINTMLDSKDPVAQNVLNSVMSPILHEEDNTIIGYQGLDAITKQIEQAKLSESKKKEVLEAIEKFKMKALFNPVVMKNYMGQLENRKQTAE